MQIYEKELNINEEYLKFWRIFQRMDKMVEKRPEIDIPIANSNQACCMIEHFNAFPQVIKEIAEFSKKSLDEAGITADINWDILAEKPLKINQLLREIQNSETSIIRQSVYNQVDASRFFENAQYASE